MFPAAADNWPTAPTVGRRPTASPRQRLTASPQLAAALPDFAVNSVCPGWVRTDMGGANATRSVGEGASGIVWLATEEPQRETGKFWRDRKVIPW
jgi:NAD(P)-dependent dehydrogenase (short-subunit alcohol dehydrogenase family)